MFLYFWIEFINNFIVEMAATLSGSVAYGQVVGSSLKDRSCFDGTVPRCFSCGAFAGYSNSAGSWQAQNVVFSLTGIPRNAVYDITGDDAHRVLTAQGVVSLRDLWVNVEGEAIADGVNYSCQFMVTMAVCDPTQAFPDAANTNYLYQSILMVTSENVGHMIRIPDIDGLVVPTGMNVVCRLSFYGPNQTTTTASFHGVSVIDD